jgi:hypothetical protein
LKLQSDEFIQLEDKGGQPKSRNAVQRKYKSWFTGVSVSALDGTIQADIIYAFFERSFGGLFVFCCSNVEYHKNHKEARWSTGG